MKNYYAILQYALTILFQTKMHNAKSMKQTIHQIHCMLKLPSKKHNMISSSHNCFCHVQGVLQKIYPLFSLINDPRKCKGQTINTLQYIVFNKIVFGVPWVSSHLLYYEVST